MKWICRQSFTRRWVICNRACTGDTTAAIPGVLHQSDSGAADIRRSARNPAISRLMPATGCFYYLIFCISLKLAGLTTAGCATSYATPAAGTSTRIPAVATHPGVRVATAMLGTPITTVAPARAVLIAAGWFIMPSGIRAACTPNHRRPAAPCASSTRVEDCPW